MMQQLNLMFFMGWGLFTAHFVLISLFVLGAVILNYAVWRKNKPFMSLKARKYSTRFFYLSWLILFLFLPYLTGSHLKELSYWFDWVFLVVASWGVALAMQFWVYPITWIYLERQEEA